MVVPSHSWRVVVTRPERGAKLWMHAFQMAGYDATWLPLLAFGPAPDMPALKACLARLGGYDAVMFVSANAVHGFWGDPLEMRALTARLWVTGPGTARALVDLGQDVSQIDQPATDAEQFDSEALWDVVRGQIFPGMRVLVVRGAAGHSVQPTQTSHAKGGGRDWLTRQCEGEGAQVDHCVSYQRMAPTWTAAQLAQARSATGSGCTWLFTSSEGIAHLRCVLPGQDWTSTCALATHPRIASAAADLGFSRVLQCRPGVNDVLSALSGMHR